MKPSLLSERCASEVVGNPSRLPALSVNRLLPVYGEPLSGSPPPTSAVLAKGFRPFFLVAAGFAASILPIWIAVLFGSISLGSYVDPTTWHAHEVVFGFAGAVIAGFLLTAVGNWTKRETIIGAPLLALALLWLAGRVAMLAAHKLPMGVAAAIDIAFLPALSVALARPLIATGNRRNFVMLVILGVLTAANAAMHLDALGVLPHVRRHALVFSVDVVVLLCLVIAARVFPMFTKNATKTEWIESSPKLDVATIVSMALLSIVDAFAPSSRVGHALAGLVAVLAAARAFRWGASRTLRIPLLWILHAGHAWIILGLALRCVAEFTGAVSPSAALHALTVGGIGSLIVGMMARVSLGHTGRLLEPPRVAVAAFVLITLAAIVRVGMPIVLPAPYTASLLISGTLWAAAFALFLVGYARMLTSPRVDGKPG